MATVNNFIGSQAAGNTFPGAALPFGMAQLSPITAYKDGYSWNDTKIRGFAMIHLSGVGLAVFSR